MDHKRFRQIEKTYIAALDMDPKSRAEYLETVCKGDPDLRERVSNLLDLDAEEESVMDLVPDDIAAELFTSIGEPDRTGQEIGNFTLIDKIADGGMGTVYRATDRTLGRKLAIKFLNRDPSERRDSVRRFELEARAASALNHPNIITLYEVGQHHGTSYIATEYIDGVTLGEAIASNKFDLPEILKISVQIAAALGAAHKAGIIHRDIKPNNIMVRDDGIVKVLDFGVAKLSRLKEEPLNGLASKTDTKQGMIIGTTLYMSPEQTRGEALDPRTDIFSFGVVLYLLLTGEQPFEGKTTSDIIASILTKEVSLPEECSERWPPELVAIAIKCLQKDRDRRYATADDLLSDLKEVRDLVRTGARGGISEMPTRKSLENVDVYPQIETRSNHSLTTNELSSRLWPRKTNLGFVAAVTAVLVLLTASLLYYYGSRSQTGHDPIRSLAVMPILNETGDSELEYVADGLTDSIISKLSQLSELTVKARTSVFRFKGKKMRPAEIREQLGVDALLIGRLERREGNLELRLGLIDARTGTEIWDDRFESMEPDITTLENSVSLALVGALRTIATDDERTRLTKQHTADPKAFGHYLKGRFFWNKRTPENFRSAIREFSSAVEIDPGFAPAYVGLADSYVLLENYSGSQASDSLPRAMAYARKALEIDASDPEAQASLGVVYHRSWRWQAAEVQYKTAIRMKPNYAPVRHWYSLYLRENGRFEESASEAKIAHELDPLSGIITVNLAATHIVLDDQESAKDLLLKSIEFDPEFPWYYSVLALAESKAGGHKTAIEAAMKGNELAENSVNSLSIYGFVLARAGRRDKAMKIAGELERKFEEGSATGRNVARVYSGIGDLDKTFEWLNRDYDNRSSFLPYVRWVSAFDPIRNDPRYTDLLRRMGLELD